MKEVKLTPDTGTAPMLMGRTAVMDETAAMGDAASAGNQTDVVAGNSGREISGAELARIPGWDQTLVQKASVRLLESKSPTHYYASIHAADDRIIRAWRLRVPAALQRWDKLLESELIKSHGLQSNLAILVQHRYLLSRADADKQVRSFLVPG